MSTIKSKYETTATETFLNKENVPEYFTKNSKNFCLEQSKQAIIFVYFYLCVEFSCTFFSLNKFCFK